MGDRYNSMSNRGFNDMPSNFSVPPPNMNMQQQQGYGGGGNNPGFKNIGQRWNNDAGNMGGGGVGDYGNGMNSFSNSGSHRGEGNYKSQGDAYADRGGNYGDYDNDRKSGSGGGSGYGPGGGNKSSYNKGYGGNDMITQEDTIFVSGMDPSTTESDIQSHFGAIGLIKKDKKTMKPKIWLYKHKDSGISKGEATVTYDDVNAAQSAITWFDGRDFNGRTVRVSLAQRQNNWQNKMGGGRGGSSRGGGSMGGGGGSSRGGNSGGDRSSSSGSSSRDFDRSRDKSNSGGRDDRSGGGGSRFSGSSSQSSGRGGTGSGGAGSGNVSHREGDWICFSCKNTNFSWRNECNRCKAPKGQGSSGVGSSGGRSGNMGGGNGGGDSHSISSGGSSRSSNYNGGGGGGNFGNRSKSDNNYMGRGGGSDGGRSDGGRSDGGRSDGSYQGRQDGGPMRNNMNDRNRSRPY